MLDRFKQFPAALASQVRPATFAGSIPALLAHPDWSTPAPLILWLHGRTANKELDPGRYLRWIRAGMAACAIDLPGHGERMDPDFQKPDRSLDLIERGVAEVDRIIEAIRDSQWADFFNMNRLAIGGMSAGGMISLRRLCDPHGFRCAAVEATTGNLAALYHPVSGRKWMVDHPAARIASLDPMQHLNTWSPIPLLALHSEADELIPVDGQRQFLETLRGHYQRSGADQGLIEWTTWPATGAPQEHIGFGRVSNDAKNAQTAFLRKWLHDTP